MNLLVKLGDLVRGLLKLLGLVSQYVVVLLQLLATGCQLFSLMVELQNSLQNPLRGFLVNFQAFIEAAESELETSIPDKPFFLRSSHWSGAMNNAAIDCRLETKGPDIRMCSAEGMGDRGVGGRVRDKETT